MSRQMQWRATFIFRNKCRHLFLPARLSERQAHKQFKQIGKERRWRLLMKTRGLY